MGEMQVELFFAVFLEFPLFFQMINRLDLGSTPNHFSKYILLHSQGSVIPDAVLL